MTPDEVKFLVSQLHQMAKALETDRQASNVSHYQRLSEAGILHINSAAKYFEQCVDVPFYEEPVPTPEPEPKEEDEKKDE